MLIGLKNRRGCNRFQNLLEELKRRVQVPDAYSFPFPGPTEIDSLRSFGIIPAHGWDV